MSDHNWPGLGFCPAPGDLGSIEQVYANVDAVARELDELQHALADIGRSGGAWEGDAAEAFAAKLGELPKYLDTGHRSMAACSLALKTWHTQLAGHLDTGRSLEARAAELRSRVKREDAELEELGASLDGYRFAANPNQEQYDAEYEEYQRRLAVCKRDHGSLDEVVATARRELDEHRANADAAARAVRTAAENHPPDPGFFDKLLGGLRAAWKGVSDWLVEHADTLSKISAGLAVAALAVSWIPVVGQVAGAVLGAGAVLCSAGALIGHGVGKARGKDVSWLDIGLDTLGVVPGVGAVKGFATAGRVATAAKGVGLAGRARAPITALADSVKLARGASVGERVAGAGKGLFEMTANPISTKGIGRTLEKLTGHVIDPRIITGSVKGLGLGHKLLGGEEQELRTVAPGPAPRPAPAPFLRAVAA
ncbi:hypothetical protein [Kitasatospora sp. NBC_00315]|uniref:hypothetical protein n=1 Tax=Kitasatospora sp. NBC_00315 TaxID=2975963 RepID=UPI003243FD3E